MKMIRMICGLAAALSLSMTVTAAADNGTEFGIEDDLTVLGIGGTLLDPDVEVKGFSVFGATQSAPALIIPVAPGNIFANGYVQISSGLYVGGSSTFTATVNLPAPTSIIVPGGTNGQVMTKNGTTGTLEWSSVSSLVSGDNLGNHIATTTLNMMTKDIKDAGYITASSEAISGQLVVYGTSTLTGLVGMGGALNVNGAVDMNSTLNVDGALTALGDSQMGDAITDAHGVNRAAEANVALSVNGSGTSGQYVSKFYSNNSLAAWIRKK